MAVAVAALPVLAGCTAATAPPTADRAGTEEYGLGQAGFEQCLTDSGVRFRTGDDGAFTVVDAADAGVTAATDRCSALTTRAATDESTAHQNAVTLAIADCLDALGYHVEENGRDGSMTDGGGRDVATYTVPAAERALAGFADDELACMRQAEAANPAPRA